MKKLSVLVLFAVSSLAIAIEPSAPVAPAESTNIEPQSEATQAADTVIDNTAPIDAEAEAAAVAESAETPAEQAGFSRGSVVRSSFTTNVQDREPVDKLNSATLEQERVFYFTELRDMSGQTATHRWEKDGEVQAEVKFDVRGPRWRVWSSKSFMPTSTGEWKVSVLNGAGQVIAEESLNLSGIPADMPQAEPEAASEPAPAAQEAESAEPQFEVPVTDQILQ